MFRNVAFVLAATILTVGQTQGQADARARAATKMRQARMAAGGEALDRMQSLSLSLQMRRHITYLSVTPGKVEERKTTLKGKIRIEFQRPDRFLKRVSTSTLAGDKLSYVEAVNGDRAWRYPPLTAVSSSRKRHVIDVNDFERSLVYQAQGARQQFNMYALFFLLQSFPADYLEYADAGWRQQDGGRADVIAVSGPDEFHAALLLDQRSHLPVAMLQEMMAVRPIAAVVGGFVFSGSARWKELVEKARREQQARRGPARRIRVEYHLTDRRPEGGVSLPHRIDTFVDGRLVEELVVTGFKINPRLNPRDFEPKPSATSYR